MAQKYNRDELVARLVRAGELEVSGEHPDEVGDYFAPGYEFHGPVDHRSIRRGIMVVEGNTIACQTFIEGRFVREFTQSPVGSLPPNGRRVVWDLSNIFTFDDEGRITEEWVRTDNRSFLQQLQATA